MNYERIEEYILNIPKFRTEGSIEQARKFYEFLGKPGQSASIVHVAGTNGKGSTCAYMNSVLTEALVKTGMFTSPHLVSVRERMRINHKLISEQEFVSIYEEVEKQLKLYNKSNCENANEITTEKENTSKMQGKYLPTFYENLFFMAMLYFEKQKAEVIILETGLGGRLDATNIIDAPKVAVITEIGKDHMEYLGDTFELIAEEKAGIIKNGSYVVYSGNRQETAKVIERKVREIGVLCKCVEKLGKQDYRFVDKKIDFSFGSRYYGYIPIRLNTCAIYQVENARLALYALENLGMDISKEAMEKGIAKCRWEGRMEEILPEVFLDGAHNEDGIDAFVASVKEDGCKGRRWLLFSAVADKEYITMKDKLTKSDLFDYIYTSPLKTARRIEREELELIFADKEVDREGTAGSNIENTVDVENVCKSAKCDLKSTDANYKVRIFDSACEGLKEILSLKKKADYVYVTGSLYLVGEIKEQFEKK